MVWDVLASAVAGWLLVDMAPAGSKWTALTGAKLAGVSSVTVMLRIVWNAVTAVGMTSAATTTRISFILFFIS
jgi:hypothetical protein